MTRNIYNLLAVALILFVLSACFCRSDRDDKPFFGSDDSAATPEADTEPAVDDPASKEWIDREEESEDRGDFLVEYVDLKDKRYEEVRKKIVADKTLEKAAVKLNQALILPEDITLRAKDCREANAYYDPKDSSITICYELMEYFFNLFRASGLDKTKSNQKMLEAVQFVFLHEVGHALIDVYELPITGNEEDAADRCSSYINLEELGSEGVDAVIAAADAFRIESRRDRPSKRNLADEHLLHEQRFYNSLCMIYGSNVRKYSYFVERGYLPKERAERCQGEYQRTVDSWVKLLKPWRKE